MHAIFSSIKKFAVTHVKTSIVIGLVVVFGGYYAYKSFTSTAGQTLYVMGTVTKDTVVTSVTGSGQVAANRQLDLKPLVSGNIVYLGGVQGQTMQAGALIAEIDTTDAEKTVRDAETALQSSQLALQKLQEPANSVSLLQDQDTLAQSNANLSNAYSGGFTNITNTFLDLPGIMSDLNTVLYSSNVVPGRNGQQNASFYGDSAEQYEDQSSSGKAQGYVSDANAKYQAALTAYNQNFSDYKAISQSSDTATINSLINETHTTANTIADAVKSATTLIQYYQDLLTQRQITPISGSTSALANLEADTGKLDADQASLLSSINTIASDLATIPENQATLDQLKSGPDPLDIQSAQLDVTEKQNALQDAKDNLADYYIRAPFSGTLAKLDVNVGDPASSGAAVATMIANEQVATISLNEVDAAKIKIGQKATFTFDAIPDLTLTGEVSEIDTVGTVTQGVVTYTVTINFDSLDDRVKPGMSVSAAIITDVHSDVLVVPSSAIKTSGGASYVQVFSTPPAIPSGTTGSQGVPSDIPPHQQAVTVGLSDDTNTEIASGLKEGDQIVVRTITSTATAPKAAAAPSLLGGGGGGGNAAGALRRIGG